MTQTPRDCCLFRSGRIREENLLCIEIIGTKEISGGTYYEYAVFNKEGLRITTSRAGGGGGFDDRNLSPFAGVNVGDSVRIRAGTRAVGRILITIPLKGKLIKKAHGVGVVKIWGSTREEAFSMANLIPVRTIRNKTKVPLPSMNKIIKLLEKGKVEIKTGAFYRLKVPIHDLLKGECIYVMNVDHDCHIENRTKSLFVPLYILQRSIKGSTRSEFLGLGTDTRTSKGFWINWLEDKAYIIMPHTAVRIVFRGQVSNFYTTPFIDLFNKCGNLFFSLDSPCNKQVARESFMYHCRQVTQKLEGASYGESNPEICDAQRREEEEEEEEEEETIHQPLDLPVPILS